MKWPKAIEDSLSEGATEFIKDLLNYDPKKRLGHKNFEDIKNHNFFKGLDWNNIRNMEPPFVPQVQNEIDTTFFADNKKFDMKELEEIQNDMDNYDHNFEHFDSTVFNTLININKKEAEKAILKANTLQREKSEMNNLEQKEFGKEKGYKFDSLLN
mmetsp:Transcript_737/g.610  ORF Transcript_737/g.610 Transcript_737/m.610 type:complete len:156 (+) Transcript_737:511-978(+)